MLHFSTENFANWLNYWCAWFGLDDIDLDAITEAADRAGLDGMPSADAIAWLRNYPGALSLLGPHTDTLIGALEDDVDLPASPHIPSPFVGLDRPGHRIGT